MKKTWDPFMSKYKPLISHLQSLNQKQTAIVALAYVEFNKTLEEAKLIDPIFYDASSSYYWNFKSVWPLKFPFYHKSVRGNYAAIFSLYR